MFKRLCTCMLEEKRREERAEDHRRRVEKRRHDIRYYMRYQICGMRGEEGRSSASPVSNVIHPQEVGHQ